MKTKGEQNRLKDEVAAPEKKISELHDDTLKHITGGTHTEMPSISKSGEIEGISDDLQESNGSGGNGCKPYIISAMLPCGDRILEGQEADCSDPANKGTKPECQRCSANR